MANDGRPVRLGDPWAPPEPTLAQILDPVALEERLKEARARRAAVLAARGPRPDRPLPPDFLATPPAAAPMPPMFEDPHPPRAGAVLEPTPAEAAAALPRPAPEALPSPADRIPDSPPPAPPLVAYAPPVAAPVAPDPTPVVPDPTPVAAAIVPDAPPSAEAVEPAASRRLAGAPVWLTFVAGIGLGAAAVAFAILPPASRQPSTETPAPTAVVESPPGEAPAPVATVESPPAEAPPPVAAVESPPAEAPPPVAAVESPPVEVVASVPPPVAGPPAAPAAAGSVAAPPTPAAVAAEPLAPAAAPVELAVPAADNSTPPVDALATARLALPVEPPAALPVETPAETPTAPPAEAPAAAVDPAAPAPAAAEPAPPAAALPARVTIHYPPSGEAAALAARDALVAAGVGAVDTLPVGFAIQRTNVRFYHAADAEAAGTVTGLLAADPSGEPPLARDFTGYATPPAPGKLEIWVAGAPAERSRSAAPAAQRPVASTPRATPAAPAPAPAAVPPAPAQAPVFMPPLPPQDQAQAVARILVERAYERLLEQIPAR
jgi:hypothetical protein